MKSEPASPRPQDSLGYLVVDVARLLSARFDARARALGITRAQWGLIAALLRAEGSSQAQLADWLQVTPMAVGRLIDRMSQAGWVERRPEPGDRRAYRIYLTTKAHEIRPQLRKISEQTEREALREVDTVARGALLDALSRVRHALADLPAVDQGPGDDES